MANDGQITIEALKASVTGVVEKKIMFLEQFAKHNARLVELKGTDYAHGTILRYNTSYQHTKDFIKWKFKSDDIDIQKLNYEFITDFEFWLKSQKKCGPQYYNALPGVLQENFVGIDKDWHAAKGPILWF